MALTGQIPAESAPPAATRARCSNDHIIYGEPCLSSSSKSGNGSSSASADRCRKVAMADIDVLLKPDDADSSSSRKLLAASGSADMPSSSSHKLAMTGGMLEPHVDHGTSVRFEAPAASRGGQEGAGPPTATYTPQEADDAGDELPSKGSALHHANGCKPCLFLNHVVGCKDGRDCSFCHFHHSIKKTPKKSKNKRDRFRKLLANDAEDGDNNGEPRPRQAGLVVRTPVDGSPTGGAASSGPGAASSSCAAPSRSMMMSL